MARSQRPTDTVIRLVQCQRWGVCEAGTADIWAVARTTVPRCQRVAAQRAAPPQRQSVQNLAVPGVQWDEAHAPRRPQQVEGVQPA